MGASFACGTTVYRGAQIHCVDCDPGTNFSDSIGSEQCKPCGVCAGEHERVLVECTAKSDVKCECQDGFYRNATTKECLPCASCCTEDGNITIIEEKCKGDGGRIGTKCKFKELQPSTCLSPSTAPVTTVSVHGQKPYPSLTTSSAMMTSLVPTTLLDWSITPTAPGSSETVHIKALASDRHSKIQGMPSSTLTGNVAKLSVKTKTAYHMPKAVVIGIWLLVAIVICALVIGCVIYVKKKSRSWRYLLVSISQKLRSTDMQLQAAAGEIESGENSSSPSGVSEPLLADEPAADATSSPLTTTDEVHKTADSSASSESVLSVILPEQKRTDTKLEKGIPPSFDNGLTHQGKGSSVIL